MKLREARSLESGDFREALLQFCETCASSSRKLLLRNQHSRYFRTFHEDTCLPPFIEVRSGMLEREECSRGRNAGKKEARERKERTPKKERKKLKPRPPPRRKAGKQKKHSGARKNWAPTENPILPGTWGGKRAQNWHHRCARASRAREARAGGREAPPVGTLRFPGARKKHPFFRGSRKTLETKQKGGPPNSTIHSAETEPEFPQGIGTKPPLPYITPGPPWRRIRRPAGGKPPCGGENDHFRTAENDPARALTGRKYFD